MVDTKNCSRQLVAYLSINNDPFKGEKMPAVETKPKRMNMREIQNKAKSLGIVPGKTKKADLIHAIQEAEGNTACFGWSNGQCSQDGCCFRQDCLKTNL